MSELLSHESAEGVSTIRLDDGRVNALSVPMLEEIHAALDAAAEAGDLVVLTGREQTLTAGFDLKTIAERTDEMLGLGARLSEKLLSFPRPVIVACNGNAIAMGSFILLSADFRIGVSGEHKLGLNEIQIGLTLPHFGIALAQYRLNPGWRQRAVLGGELMGPEEARAAGFLDRVVEADELEAATAEAVAWFAGINGVAHEQTKPRLRAGVLAELREAIETSGGEAGW